MKDEIYNALATLNRGFGLVLESLKIMEQQGIVTAEYVQQQTEIAEEFRASLNHMVLDKMISREEDDWANFGKLKIATEARLKES